MRFSETDFTLSKYETLCRCMLDFGYATHTVRDYLGDGRVGEEPRAVILRHDVDRRPNMALRMAEAEHRLGIRSTYYFRSIPSVFRPKLIRQVRSLGHEVGFHYESLVQADGDLPRAWAYFRRDLEKFREICDIETVCMHGSPLSRWDNRKLWANREFRDFGLLGEPYISVDYSRVLYLSDTGRTWAGFRHNRRDRTESSGACEVSSTNDLITALSDNKGHFMILTHPERWSANRSEFLFSYTMDMTANTAKSIIGGTGIP